VHVFKACFCGGFVRTFTYTAHGLDSPPRVFTPILTGALYPLQYYVLLMLCSTVSFVQSFEQSHGCNHLQLLFLLHSCVPRNYQRRFHACIQISCGTFHEVLLSSPVCT
jgi:hypothetical protein